MYPHLLPSIHTVYWYILIIDPVSQTNKIEKTWGEFFFIVLHHGKAFASALETLRLRGTPKEFNHTTLKENAATITIKKCQRIITGIVSSADTFNSRDFGKFLHKLTLEKLVTYLIHHPDDANKTHASWRMFLRSTPTSAWTLVSFCPAPFTLPNLDNIVQFLFIGDLAGTGVKHITHVLSQGELAKQATKCLTVPYNSDQSILMKLGAPPSWAKFEQCSFFRDSQYEMIRKMLKAPRHPSVREIADA